MNSQRHPDLSPQKQQPKRREKPDSGAKARERILSEWHGFDVAARREEKTVRARPVESVLKTVMDGLSLEERRGETEIVKVWNHSLDPTIVAHAQPTGLRKGTLFVSVDSNVWLYELIRYRRQEILERLQHSFGRETIARLSFRVGQ